MRHNAPQGIASQGILAMHATLDYSSPLLMRVLGVKSGGNEAAEMFLMRFKLLAVRESHEFAIQEHLAAQFAGSALFGLDTQDKRRVHDLKHGHEREERELLAIAYCEVVHCVFLSPLGLFGYPIGR